METVDMQPLSPIQERRIVTYIEEKSMEIMRAFQRRYVHPPESAQATEVYIGICHIQP